MNSPAIIPTTLPVPEAGPPETRGDKPLRGGGRFLVFLRKYWWVPLLTLLFACGGATAYMLLAPPVYVSTASMWETEQLRLSDGVVFSQDATTYLGTQIEVLKSLRMRQIALDQLRGAGANSVPLAPDGNPIPIGLGFRETPRSTVFVITATSADPAYCQSFLNTLMTAYLDYKRDVRKKSAGQTASSLAAQVKDLEVEMKNAEDALAAFEQTNSLPILEKKGAMAGEYLEKLETEISDLQLQSQLLQSVTADSDSSRSGLFADDGGAMNLVTNFNSRDNSDKASTYEQLALLKEQWTNYSQVYRPMHPKMIALNEEIARGEKLVEMFRRQSREERLAALAIVQMKMTNVAAEIKDWNEKVTEASGLIAQAEQLRQDVNRSASTFDRLTTLLQNVDITRNTDLESLDILEPASTAKRGYKAIIVGWVLAVLGGLGAGAGIVFLIEKRDDRFTSVVEVNSTLGDTIFGLLPEVTRKGGGAMHLLEHNDSRHGYAESYRRILTALRFHATAGERPKVLLITSAMPNEGKSTIAANLARTLAFAGSKVLLVDADLRRGGLDRLLNLQSAPGFSELLRGECEMEKAAQKDALPNFTFLAGGAPSGHPGNLFLCSRLDALLAQWRRDFDYVIIDSSPLFAADDVSCLAPKVDGTLFVVRRGYSGAVVVSEAIELLVQRQAKVLGVIFNGADPASRNYYYYKFRGYNASVKTA